MPDGDFWCLMLLLLCVFCFVGNCTLLDLQLKTPLNLVDVWKGGKNIWGTSPFPLIHVGSDIIHRNGKHGNHISPCGTFREVMKLMKLNLVPNNFTSYRRDPNKSEGGTQLLHAPPTAHIVYSISSLAVAVDTLGDTIGATLAIYQFSPLTPQRLNFISKFEKKSYSFFWALGVV